MCFLDKRSNRSLHHSSNFSSVKLPSFAHVPKMAAGERFERPYPDSKSRVLSRDDPASRFERDRFHAPHAENRRLVDVMAKPAAIGTCAICQFAMIAAALAVKLRRNFDLEAFDFNHLCTHNFGSSEENRTPIAALKGPHPGR